MYEHRFSKWLKWADREEMRSLDRSGVYALCVAGREISGQHFEWRKDIIYIGMTKAGLKSRLRQFDAELRDIPAHGGADRVRKRYPDYGALVNRLYVSVARYPGREAIERLEEENKGIDVAEFEALCFCQYTQRYGRLPEFNRYTSLKFSRSRSNIVG